LRAHGRAARPYASRRGLAAGALTVPGVL